MKTMEAGSINTLTVQKRKLLVLDLDETLVHTSYSPILGAEYKSKKGLFYLYERPHLKDFLDRFFVEYDLAIWSASKAEYVKWVIKSTVLCRYEYLFVNTRRNCQRILGKNGSFEYHKDITPYLSHYDKVIMLDDYPELVMPIQYCLKVPEYRGGEDDFLSIFNYELLKNVL